jgi:hypothetical protein
MVGKASEDMSLIRRCQRSHAKKRFSERFGLTVNRDLMREMEQKIARGEVVLIEKKPQIRNYLVTVQAKLIAVGYNTFTKRVVTALPDDYMERIPIDVIHWARVKLLKDESVIKSDIRTRRNAQLLYCQNESVSHYLLRYPGLIMKTGYDSREDRLVPYRPQASGYRHKMSAAKRFGMADLDATTAEDVKQKIRSGQSTFLWRYSDAVKFHAVQLGTHTLRVGYNSRNGNLYQYGDAYDEGHAL